MNKSQKPRTNIDGYELALDVIRSKLGADRAPIPWLAEQLGVTRQYIWGYWKDGVPEKYVDAVAKLTGLSPTEVRPQSMHQHIPGELFQAIADSAKQHKISFTARLIEVIRNGLGMR